MIPSVWIEKYRPTLLGDVVGQEMILDEMRSIVEDGAPMQHFLFHSPEAGTGKTTLARVMAHHLGLPIHEFNASTKKQRGIEFIEEDVIPLATCGFPAIILLDEADRITPQAQDALKGVIENSTAFFILTCNDLNKVSRWLKSRCQVRTFAPIGIETMYSRIIEILAHEGFLSGDNVMIIEKQIRNICRAHEGDLRNAIGATQAWANMELSSRESFVRGLVENTTDLDDFLYRACVQRDMRGAFSLLDLEKPRDSVRRVFKFGMIQGLGIDGVKIDKHHIIDASIQAERDLIIGVEPEIALWAFTKELGSGGLIGKVDSA